MSGRNLIGLILIIIGALLILQFTVEGFSLGWLWTTYWPILLLLIGLHNFRSRQTSLIGLILVFIGIFFQLRNLQLLPSPVQQMFWPLFIIFIGLWILISSRKPKQTDYREYSTENSANYTAIMSGTEARIVTKDFKGGSALAIMGGIEIDLRDAELQNDVANMELTAIMGSVLIKVPEHWQIQISSLPFLGACENHTRFQVSDSSKQALLNIQCTAIMGGIEIKN